MHLRVFTYGTTYNVQRWIDILHSNLLPYPNTKYPDMKVQLIARPLQLHDLIFPKECLPNVLKGIGWTGDNPKDKQLEMMGMRLALGVKKIPELDLNVNPILSCNHEMGIYPIGIKEDGVWGKETEFEGAESL